MAPSAEITAIVTTCERPGECKAAVASVLAQTLRPVEVIVCDDGSSPAAEQAIRAWAETEPDVRYLRTSKPSGGPARVRNLGVEAATTPWVAFLDDDDSWFPTKLELQAQHLAPNGPDVVSAQALRASGTTYPVHTNGSEPSRSVMLRNNPLIMSTVVARRSALVDAGGFPEDPRLHGIEDYCLWLELADRGARFRILEEELATYSDIGANRLSVTRQSQRSLARYVLGRWRAHPLDRPAAAAVVSHGWRTLKVELRGRVASRRR